MSDLPYPSAVQAQGFPWPDEDRIKAEADAKAAASTSNYGRQSPYNPDMGGGAPYMPSVEAAAGGYPSQGEKKEWLVTNAWLPVLAVVLDVRHLVTRPISLP